MEQHSLPTELPAGAVGRAAVLVSCSLLAVLILYCGAALRHWYSDPFRGTTIPHAEPLETRILNRTVLLPKLDNRGRSILQNRPLILAPVPCGSCTDPDAWVRLLDEVRGLPVVAVFPCSDKEIEAKLRLNAPHVFQLGPLTGKGVPTTLNAIAPLLVAADAQGKIYAVSGSGETASAFSRRVGIR